MSIHSVKTLLANLGSSTHAMGVYYKGFGASFTTHMKLWHVGRQEYCPGQAGDLSPAIVWWTFVEHALSVVLQLHVCVSVWESEHALSFDLTYLVWHGELVMWLSDSTCYFDHSANLKARITYIYIIIYIYIYLPGHFWSFLWTEPAILFTLTFTDSLQTPDFTFQSWSSVWSDVCDMTTCVIKRTPLAAFAIVLCSIKAHMIG